jgi:hypothetical protein
MSLRKKIEKWYEGEFIPYRNNPYDSVVIMGGRYKRHWTASVARLAVQFWVNHWQWTIGTVLAICGLGIALTRH